jgi:hypothetical protein
MGVVEAGRCSRKKAGIDLTDALPEIIADVERNHAIEVALVEKRRRTELSVERARAETRETDLRRPLPSARR